MANLFLICGLPGAGKTTLARQLARSQRALRLCPDEWIVDLLADPADRADSERLRNVVEQKQLLLGLEALRLGTNVILENGFWAREERNQYREAGEAAGARVFLLFLDVSMDELLRRVEVRNRSEPAGAFRITPAEMVEWAALFQPPDAEELAHYQPLSDLDLPDFPF